LINAQQVNAISATAAGAATIRKTHSTTPAERSGGEDTILFAVAAASPSTYEGRREVRDAEVDMKEYA
jgi:hypothetical protein